MRSVQILEIIYTRMNYVQDIVCILDIYYAHKNIGVQQLLLCT